MQLLNGSTQLNPRDRIVLLFRVLGYAGVGVLALLFPEAGEHRYWLAFITLTVAGPSTIILSVYFHSAEKEWVDPLYDLCMTISLVHLVPDMWVPALCIGLMIALAPSVSIHPKSQYIYSLFGGLLVIGMGTAGWLYDAEDWLLTTLVIAAIYPSVIFYANFQKQRIEALRERYLLLQNLYQLAGSVAHDFNNVLTGISGHTELAMMALDSSHEARQDMIEVINGVDRASLLCRQLLSFSMYDEAPQTIDLGEEVLSLTHLLKPVVPKGVDIQFEPYPEALPTTVNRPQLQQVVMNVILNAGEAVSLDPKPIKIEVARINSRESPVVQLTVIDQGVGIPEHQIDRVFDPLFTTKDQGHGLGLANANKTLEANGGTISIESVEHRGTKVVITLPLSPDDIETEITQVSLETSGMALVIDDEPAVREITERFLKQMGYEVTTAAGADEGIAVLRSKLEDCRLVVLDLDMPNRDGWSCLREIRSFNATVGVIISSGYDPMTTNPPKLTQRDALMRKPFHKEHLERVVSSLV